MPVPRTLVSLKLAVSETKISEDAALKSIRKLGDIFRLTTLNLKIVAITTI